MCVIMLCGMNVLLSAKLAKLSFIKALKYTHTCSGNTVYEEVTIHISVTQNTEIPHVKKCQTHSHVAIWGIPYILEFNPHPNLIRTSFC
jgi:hypothetical protein